jgi:integrase
VNNRRETPIRRMNPSGRRVWVARYTERDGRRRSAGTFDLKREAQAAIDAAYQRPVRADTLGLYAERWTRLHPRAPRTNATNEHRVSRVLDVVVQGDKLRDWQFDELRRRHAVELVDHLLRVQGRSASGAANVLRALSAMAEDAITDEVCELNAFKGVRVRASDPRATKQSRRVAVYSFAQMHAIAAAAGPHEAMLRVLSDCGLRIGELLGLERRDFDGQAIHNRGSSHEGRFTEGDHVTKRHVRTVPVPAPLAELLAARPARIDTPLLFPTAGGTLWRESNWRRQVWNPVKALVDEEGELLFADMQAATPHSFRHSWETHLHAAGIDPADLAAMAGHTISTMQARYVHALNQSYDAVRRAVG